MVLFHCALEDRDLYFGIGKRIQRAQSSYTDDAALRAAIAAEPHSYLARSGPQPSDKSLLAWPFPGSWSAHQIIPQAAKGC